MLLAAAALLIEAAFGYPDALFRRIGHPVTWMGRWLAALERRLNTAGATRARGVLALLLLLLPTVMLAILLQAALLRLSWPGFMLLAAASGTLLAQRSLHTHVAAVAEGLGRGLEPGRAAVAHIVGRDPASLDAPAIARAAIESLAENFSDGVTAPAFWLACFGLPGAALYKAANTADSMIGHRSPRYLRFGWAAARLDDVLNLPASRLSALLLALAAGRRAPASLRAAWRDAAHHRSPNAGWPEAAMAGALGLRLAGPRSYGGTVVQDGWMGDGTPDATPLHIRRALALYRRACLLQWAALAALALTVPG